MSFTDALPTWAWVVMAAVSAVGVAVGVKMVRGGMAATLQKPVSVTTNGFVPVVNFPNAQLEPVKQEAKPEGTLDLKKLVNDLKRLKEQ